MTVMECVEEQVHFWERGARTGKRTLALQQEW
mgnify:CR=1 FL=1